MAVNTILAVFLVSTFVVNGVVGLWASKSPRHWFIRTAIVLGILSPLLLAGALEPFVALLLQSTTIAAIGSHWRQRQVLSNDESVIRIQRNRFSLASGLLATGLFATLLAIGIRLPELNGNAWLSMVLIGICSGLCVSVAQIGPPEGNRWRTIALILLCGVLFAIPLAWFDWLVPSLVGWAGWPPESINFGGFVGIGDEERPLTLWFAVCVCVAAFMYFWRLLTLRSKTNRNRFFLAGTVAAMSIPPVVVLWIFLRPVTVESLELPTPNAYVRLVELGDSIAASQFDENELDWEAAPVPELSGILSEIRDDLNELHDLLQRPAKVPLDYQSDDLRTDAMMNFRTTARALSAKGDFALRTDNPDLACRCFVDAIRLGVSCRNGGLLIDGLVGIATSAEGSRSLYVHRDKYPKRTCLEAASAIQSFSNDIEPYESFKARDRVWTQATMGWHGRLQQFLFETTGSSLLFSDEDIRDQFLAERAMMRLLAMELALRAFYLDNNNWPASDNELEPAYISTLPRDPFDEANRHLKYVRTEDGYQLYSLGVNRMDDGGEPATQSDGFFARYGGAGDLRLSGYFLIDSSSGQDAENVDETSDNQTGW